jgi:hypothetical protein
MATTEDSNSTGFTGGASMSCMGARTFRVGGGSSEAVVRVRGGCSGPCYWNDPLSLSLPELVRLCFFFPGSLHVFEGSISGG